MGTISFDEEFRAVNDWARRKGSAGAAFPTCEQVPTADPYIFNHGVVLLRYADISVANLTASQLGIDSSSAQLARERWRELFTAANAYAHSVSYFHAFLTFQQYVDPGGAARFWTVLVRSTGPGPEGNGITWRDLPTEEVFPELPPGAASFLSLPPETWMQRLNLWALAHDQAAALPTGWAAKYASKWVVGTVLFEHSAATRVTVSGTELGYDQEICAKQAEWQEPVSLTGSQRIIASLDSLAPPAPLAVDEAPFGDPLYVDPSKVDYFRCIAQRTGSCVIAIFAKGPDAVRLEMRPREDQRRLIYFGNRIGDGAWIVAHRFNLETQEGEGEVVSAYRKPGEGQDLAFELTTGAASQGQIEAHTVGFVKQGILGIAHPIMSFAYSTFMNLSAGMDLSFTWVAP